MGLLIVCCCVDCTAACRDRRRCIAACDAGMRARENLDRAARQAGEVLRMVVVNQPIENISTAFVFRMADDVDVEHCGGGGTQVGLCVRCECIAHHT